MNARKPNVPHDNLILSELPNDIRSRLDARLKVVSLPLGTDLYASYEPIKYIHFPIAAIASIIASTSEGQTSEVGLVGPEGAVGLETLMGAESVPYRCTIQHPDSGYRLPIEIVREEFRRGGGYFRNGSSIFIEN